MRRVKKRSIQNYMILSMAMLSLALLMLMFLSVNILMNRLIHYEMKSELTNLIEQSAREILDAEDLSEVSRSTNRNDYMHFQIITENDEILSADEELAFTIEDKSSKKLYTLTADDTKYYVCIRKSKFLSRRSEEDVYYLAYVNKAEVDGRYRTTRYFSYGMIPIAVVFVFFASFYLSRRIADPITEMCRKLEQIENEKDLSKRMLYEGNLSELDFLTSANNQMLGRLSNIVKRQKQFSSDVAHELRTPLAVIMAECELTQEKDLPAERYQEALEVIYAQAQKTNQIVMQLLHLNRMGNDHFELQLEELQLDDIVQSICEDIENREAVCFELNLGGVSAEADLGLIMLALQNLIQNAVKYSEKPANVKITTHYLENYAIISVTDYGCGIAKEELEDIFTPFFRSEKARSSEGFGLGLPLAKRIAEIHKGEILVESELSKGSTFTLKLPVKA